MPVLQIFVSTEAYSQLHNLSCRLAVEKSYSGTVGSTTKQVPVFKDSCDCKFFKMPYGTTIIRVHSEKITSQT